MLKLRCRYIYKSNRAVELYNMPCKFCMCCEWRTSHGNRIEESSMLAKFLKYWYRLSNMPSWLCMLWHSKFSVCHRYLFSWWTREMRTMWSRYLY